MKRQKKTNNIFSRPILPESLFYQEVQKDYTIGGVKVEGCWLAGSSPQLYQSNVKSALELSQLKAQHTQLRRNTNQSTADLFRMAQLRKKMENFSNTLQSPTKKKQKFQNLQISADNLILQKIHKFWGTFTRKCRIYKKTIIFTSQKNNQEVSIDMRPYTIQLEERYRQKAKLDKDKNLEKQKGQEKQKDKKKEKEKGESDEFAWIQDRTMRLFFHGQNLRSYCIYGDQATLTNMIKKLKIESIEINKIDFLKILSKQFEQKMIILFGNRLRVYEYNTKEFNQESLNIAFDLIEKSNILDSVEEDTNPKRSQRPLDQSYHQSDSSKKSPSQIANPKSPNILLSSIILSPTRGQQPQSPTSPMFPQLPTSSQHQLHNTLLLPPQSQSQFRLRSRRSTINYQDFDFDQEQKDVNVEDFNLEIKEVAHSDSEEQANRVDNWREDHFGISVGELRKRSVDLRNQPITITIHQFSDEDSGSSNYSIQANKRIQNFVKQLRNQSQQFQLQQAPMTHTMCITYFQDFYAYSQPRMDLIVYQQLPTTIQHEHMLTPVCTYQSFCLEKSRRTPQLYLPTSPIFLQLSNTSNQIFIILQYPTQKIKQKLSINLKNIRYTVDESQLLYMKYLDGALCCAGKLRVILGKGVGENPFGVEGLKGFEEITTVGFFQGWVQGLYGRWERDRFVDYKRRNHQLCQKWNHKIIKKIINKADQQEFFKAIFSGIPPELSKKISKNLQKPSSALTRSQTHIESTSKTFSSSIYNMLEAEIMKMKIYDIRVHIKISSLVDIVMTTHKNYFIQKRLDDICMIYQIKFGNAYVEKIMAVFVVEVLKKVQALVVGIAGNGIQALIQFFSMYFQVEYEIDELMVAISAYFN